MTREDNLIVNQEKKAFRMSYLQLKDVIQLKDCKTQTTGLAVMEEEQSSRIKRKGRCKRELGKPAYQETRPHSAMGRGGFKPLAHKDQDLYHGKVDDGAGGGDNLTVDRLSKLAIKGDLVGKGTMAQIVEGGFMLKFTLQFSTSSNVWRTWLIHSLVHS